MCTPLYTWTQMFWTHAHKYINPVSRFACRNETTQSRHQLSDSTPTWAFTSGTYGVSYGSTRCLIHSWAACCSDAKCCYRTQSSINWLVSCLVSLRPQENLKAASFGPRAPLWVTLLWMKLCRFPLQLVHDEGPSFVSPRGRWFRRKPHQICFSLLSHILTSVIFPLQDVKEFTGRY